MLVYPTNGRVAEDVYLLWGALPLQRRTRHDIAIIHKVIPRLRKARIGLSDVLQFQSADRGRTSAIRI